MNKIYLIGNLTKDPELTETPNGTAVCKFSIAVHRFGKDEVDYFNCTAWRGQAESINKYCRKGNKIAVNGSIQLGSYEGKDGIKRQSVDVMVSEAEFLTPKQADTEERQDKPKGKPKLEAFDDSTEDSPF